MISTEVINRAENFSKRFSYLKNSSKVYDLDGSWTSLETLNLIFFEVAKQNSAGIDTSSLVKDIAAYTGFIAAGYWDDFETFISLEDEASGIKISAKNDSGIHEIFIEQDLNNFLSGKYQSILIRPKEKAKIKSRPIWQRDNLLKLYCFGLFTALSPYGQGIWQEIGEQKSGLSKYQEKFKKTLAITNSKNYERIYPEEKLGQVAELYLDKLLWPPALSDESYFGEGAALSLIEFFKNYGVSSKQKRPLLRNLISLSDETSSSAAKLLYTLLLDEIPQKEDFYLFGAHRKYTASLRPSLLYLKQELFKDNSAKDLEWLISKKGPEAMFDHERERALGFLPNLKLSTERVLLRTEKETPFFRALFEINSLEIYLEKASPYSQSLGTEQESEESLTLSEKLFYELEKLLEAEPHDVELNFQKAYLLLENESIDENELENLDRLLKYLLTDPNAENDSRLYHLLGLFAEKTGAFEKYFNHLEKAFALKNSDSFINSDISFTYLLSLVKKHELPKALKTARKLEESSLNYKSFETDLLLATTLMKLGRRHEFKEVMSRLLKVAPLNSDVFQFVWGRDV